MPKGIIAEFFGYISDKGTWPQTMECDNTDNYYQFNYYQYYQNTTKGFEFTDANFTITAKSKISKGDK